jgi:hypothetical protein
MDENLATILLMDQSKTELLNKTVNLLSSKDPLAYQTVVAMDSPSLSSPIEDTPMDDVSEYKRYAESRGINVTEEGLDGDDYFGALPDLGKL